MESTIDFSLKMLEKILLKKDKQLLIIHFYSSRMMEKFW